jgi:hypothetical protein
MYAYALAPDWCCYISQAGWLLQSGLVGLVDLDYTLGKQGEGPMEGIPTEAALTALPESAVYGRGGFGSSAGEADSRKA